MRYDCLVCGEHLYTREIDSIKVCLNTKCPQYNIELKRLTDLLDEYNNYYTDDTWTNYEDDF